MQVLCRWKLRSVGERLIEAFLGCGGILNSPSGSITSPNYPSTFGGGVECVWKISVNHGNSIQVSFADIDIQQGSSLCQFKFVQVV